MYVYHSVPSPPREVMAIPTTPTQVNITWHSPSHPNAEYKDIVYVLQYHTGTTDTQSQVRQEIKGNPYQGQGEGIFYSYIIRNLTAATIYYFKVIV